MEENAVEDKLYQLTAAEIISMKNGAESEQWMTNQLTALGVSWNRHTHPTDPSKNKDHIRIASSPINAYYKYSGQSKVVEKALVRHRAQVHAVKSAILLERLQNGKFDPKIFSGKGVFIGGGVTSGESSAISFQVDFSDILQLEKDTRPQQTQQPVPHYLPLVIEELKDAESEPEESEELEDVESDPEEPEEESEEVSDAEAGKDFAPFKLPDPKAVLWYVPDRFTDFNDSIIAFVRETAMNDPTFTPAHRVNQYSKDNFDAGAIAYGAGFKYRSENWSPTPIPHVFKKLIRLAHRFLRIRFDIILLKIYLDPTEKLSRHQDVDGSDMNVACVTFATDPSQVRQLVFYGVKKNENGKWASATSFAEFSPAIGSMWYMAGSTNSEYSHSVRPAKDAVAGGMRVSVSLRLSAEQPRDQ